MASLIGQILRNLGERLDEDLLPGLYTITSLSTAAVQREFKAAELPFCNPIEGVFPPEEELEAAAEAVVHRAVNRASVRGALGGMGGAFAIPPEVALALVQTMRMAQRLAVLYGIELETDRGKLLLSRAIYAAYELKLPEQQALDMRLSQLPQVARQQSPDVQRTTAWIARTVAWQITRHIGGRVTRIVPGIGAGVGAWDAHRSLRAQSGRIRAVYRRSWSGTMLSEDAIAEAEEILEAEEYPAL
ncbi:MAG: hypothetical protein ACI8RZ_006666 [Myxococcota bacterium]|jgi:hypothetical protein